MFGVTFYLPMGIAMTSIASLTVVNDFWSGIIFYALCILAAGFLVAHLKPKVTPRWPGRDDARVAADSLSRIADDVDCTARQIELLTLNAVIEAARAGEKGREFAVFANEAKTLALAAIESGRHMKPGHEQINRHRR